MNLTSISKEALLTWAEIDFTIDVVIYALTTIGQFLVAAAILSKSVSLPSPRACLKGCFGSLARKLGFFSGQEDVTPQYALLPDNSVAPQAGFVNRA